MKLTKTNNLKVLALSTCFACSLNTAVYADNINSLEGIKLGFGYDMGLGITAQTQNINGFLGNDGLPVGLQANFANNFDAYAQIIPELEIGKDTGFGLGIGLGIRHQF